MPTFSEIKAVFAGTAWTLDHESKDDDGTVRSVYFSRTLQVFPKRIEERIRISDHHLGCTVYGEPQGQNLNADFVLTDFDENTPAEDFVKLAENEDMITMAARGYTPSMPEWSDAVAEYRDEMDEFGLQIKI